MERIFIAADLENLLTVARREGRLAPFLDTFVGTVRRIASRGLLLGGVAVCDTDLQRASAFALAGLNVRVHARPNDEPDAADLRLVEYVLRERPGSTDTVVLASGDHIFVDAVVELTEAGHQVVVVATPGRISHELYRVATRYVPLDIDA